MVYALQYRPSSLKDDKALSPESLSESFSPQNQLFTPSTSLEDFKSYRYTVGELQKTYHEGGIEEKRLVRKIDKHILTCICGLYFLNYLDRSNIGNAKVGGMEEGLGLTSTQYSVSLLIFAIGYLLAEIPSNMVLTRIRPSIYLPMMTMAWGFVAAMISLVNSASGLIAARFVLGFVESGFFPGILYYLSSWYRKRELAKRIALIYVGGILSGAFGGLIAGALISVLNGARNIAGWRWLFIIEGSATMLASLVVVWFLPDFPSSTSWLPPEERELARFRKTFDRPNLRDAEPESKLTHKEALLSVLKDPRSYLFTLIYTMIQGATTITYFIPTITLSMGFVGSDAQFMTIPFYVVAALFAVAVAFMADKAQNRPLFIIGPLSLAAFSYFICAFTQNHVARYMFLCLGFSAVYGALPVSLAWLSETIDYPDEKRAIAQAFVNMIANLALLYGSFLWPSSSSPGYSLGFGMMAGFCSAGAIAAFATHLVLLNENKKDQTLEHESPEDEDKVRFTDRVREIYSRWYL
ncbi:major facilitator superfamily domain-containing protein [Phakopsora pachyrhizi]|uniref:Major facilitator superfamily domain-containing protein n=1 Tax=Phakopsora pachyrhizi TaxID=170000 RepID=A0AAV0ACT6_PHAPC|nr:major facilitator superfamily domain-containing protein [Phakopsora pachyrhizi]CAH7665799.1 major facilitator superfamily domain-containing protein [Phakopsora pachyrhizi]